MLDGVTAVLSGHLHNRDALAARLGLGRDVSTPLLLAAGYRRWGRELVARLQGTFALLAWDGERRHGVVAVDRLGAAGVFVFRDGPALTVGTEVETLLGVLPRAPAPDADAVVQWMVEGMLPPGTTLFGGIRRLEGGTLLALDERGSTECRYWRPSTRSQGIPAAEAAAALREGVIPAVQRRIPEPEAPAVMLGGGLDSGTVAGAAARLRGGGFVRAYSAVFPAHETVDEAALIDAVTSELGTRSGRIVTHGGSTIPSSLRYLDTWALPPASPNLFFKLPLLELAAREGNTVMLDGQGGDELFGLSRYLLADRIRTGRVRDARRLARALVGDEPGQGAAARAAFRAFGLKGLVPAPAHGLLRRLRPDHYSPDWLGAEAARGYAVAGDPWRWKRTPGPRWRAYLADLLTGYRERAGAHDFLRHMSAMGGIEGAHPFHDDADLVDLVLQLPPELAFDERVDRPLLREAMAGVTPDVVRLRREKSYFNQLVLDSLARHDWPTVIRVLEDPQAEVRTFVQLDKLRDRLLRAAQASGTRVRWATTVWRVFMTECWLRTQVDSSFPQRALETWQIPEPGYSLRPAG